MPGTQAQNVRCVALDEQFAPARIDGDGLADELLPPPPLGALLLLLPLLHAASSVTATMLASPMLANRFNLL
jgi:hypothetical protein